MSNVVKSEDLWLSTLRLSLKVFFLLFIIFSYLNMSMNFYLVDSCQLFVVSFLTIINFKLITKFVENNGVEPLTSCVQGRRSSQLS